MQFQVGHDTIISSKNCGVVAVTESVIRAIEAILAKGDRAEVLPGPNGTVKVIHVRRSVVADTKKK